MFVLLLDKQLDSETLQEFVSAITGIDKKNIVLNKLGEIYHGITSDDDYMVDYIHHSQGDAREYIEVMVKDELFTYIEQIKKACSQFDITCYYDIDEDHYMCIPPSGEERVVLGIEYDINDEEITYFKELPDDYYEDDEPS